MILRLAERPSDKALYPWRVVSSTKAFWDMDGHCKNICDAFGVTPDKVRLFDLDTDTPESITVKPGASVKLPGESVPRTVLPAPPPAPVIKTIEERLTEVEAALKRAKLL